MDTTDTTTPVEHPAIRRLRDELDEIGMDVLTSYTLADAVREGSGVTRQATGSYVKEDSSCVLGAAFIAAKARGYVS